MAGGIGSPAKKKQINYHQQTAGQSASSKPKSGRAILRL